MEEKRIPVITINREYGAGGRTVAAGLSEKLGIPWYDQDFITETARDSGYSEEDIQENGESLSKLDALIDSVAGISVQYTSIHDSIFEAQKSEITKLAEKPCIIVGRLSNVILKEAGINTFDVFLYADLDVRAEHIKNQENGKLRDYKRFVEKRDFLRKNYYKNYAKKDFDDCRNYNLCIDTGRVSKKVAVDLIANALQEK